jgi:hypothetical protein
VGILAVGGQDGKVGLDVSCKKVVATSYDELNEDTSNVEVGDICAHKCTIKWHIFLLVHHDMLICYAKPVQIGSYIV